MRPVTYFPKKFIEELGLALVASTKEEQILRLKRTLKILKDASKIKMEVIKFKQFHFKELIKFINFYEKIGITSEDAVTYLKKIFFSSNIKSQIEDIIKIINIAKENIIRIDEKHLLQFQYEFK